MPWGPPLSGAGSAETEFLGAGGLVLGRGGTAPAGAVYRRAASVRRLAAQPGVLIVEVRVGFNRGGDDRFSRDRAPQEVVVVALLPEAAGP